LRLQSFMQLEAPHNMCEVAALSEALVAGLRARAVSGAWLPPTVRQAAHVATKLAMGRSWLGYAAEFLNAETSSYA
jgi:hypothetical protein